MAKKQWIPIRISKSDITYYGRWFVQNYEKDGTPKPLGQVYAIGKLRIEFGE
ncbi:hypothetical protein [Brevibacillus porteri]|uniref:hypothetical protein n=1 Tax=Brevibacillus porteri TaxID=2126350 RepID=UPI003D1918FD